LNFLLDIPNIILPPYLESRVSSSPALGEVIKMVVFLTRENKAKRVRNYEDRHRAPISDVTFSSMSCNLFYLAPPPPLPRVPVSFSHVVTIVPRDFSRSRFPIAREDCTCSVSPSFSFSLFLSLWSRKRSVERANPFLEPREGRGGS